MPRRPSDNNNGAQNGAGAFSGDEAVDSDYYYYSNSEGEDEGLARTGIARAIGLPPVYENAVPAAPVKSREEIERSATMQSESPKRKESGETDRDKELARRQEKLTERRKSLDKDFGIDMIDKDRANDKRTSKATHGTVSRARNNNGTIGRDIDGKSSGDPRLRAKRLNALRDPNVR